jgi:hypothetical protein
MYFDGASAKTEVWILSEPREQRAAAREATVPRPERLYPLAPVVPGTFAVLRFLERASKGKCISEAKARACHACHTAQHKIVASQPKIRTLQERRTARDTVEGRSHRTE